MSAKSTMEELRELNVRRQREAQSANLPGSAGSSADAPGENDKMIILSNDNAIDHVHEATHEQSNAPTGMQSHMPSSVPAHEDVHLAADEGVSPATPQLLLRQQVKGKGRTGQKPALSATDRLFAQTAREPIVRLNIELTESMHTQLKQYCVQQKVPIRMLVTALIEDFFAKEVGGS